MRGRPGLLQRAAAEAIGTFFLVLAGCGAIVTDSQRHGALGVVGVGLVFFLVLLAAIAVGATVPSISAWRAVLLEAVLTAFLMLVIMSVATDTRAVGAPAAIAIAAAVGLAAIAFGRLTGASLNTARSFGPALVLGQWSDFWVYVLGPLIGAPCGALVYEFVRGEHPQRPTLTSEPEESGGNRTVRLPA